MSVIPTGDFAGRRQERRTLNTLHGLKNCQHFRHQVQQSLSHLEVPQVVIEYGAHQMAQAKIVNLASIL